jgi:PAS domain S-box-containing protein
VARLLHVLIVEDSEDDAVLMERQLQLAGFQVASERVQTREEMVEALAADTWDVVLCDYRLPQFDGPSALKVVQEAGIDLPFIIVSGAVGEEIAAAAMRAGAHDFVSKNNLARLHPAVERELAEAEIRRSHRSAEAALRASEVRYRTLMANLPIGVFRADSGGTIISANPALAAMLGYPDDHSLTGVSSPQIFADAGSWRELVERLAGSGVVVDHEALIVRRDGSTFWGQLNVRAVSDPQGALLLDGTVADIDRRRQLEVALIRGKEEWERTFDAVRELILISDEELTTVRANRTAAEFFGLGPDEIIGRSAYELIHGAPRPAGEQELLQQVANGLVNELQVRRDDLGCELHFSLTPRFDEDRKLAGVVHVGRDVTDQRRLDEVLRRQAMIEQAEHIFRTFRHEVGNALNTLKTTLTVLRSSYREFTEEQREIYFGRCLESFRLAEKLLRALRTYQSLDRVHPRPLELVEYLQSTSGLLFTAARDRAVDCGLDPCTPPVRVSADPDALTRILLNLVDNAVEATAVREQPTITISCRVVHHQAVVAVRDNGRGISPEDRPHVFAPLFTTRAEGSGMGLAIVQKLVVQMGGLTTLDSELDRGCTVALLFPVIR